MQDIDKAPINQPADMAGPKGQPRNDESQKNSKIFIWMFACILLAIGGFSFGLLATLDGSAKISELNEEIANLSQKLSSGTQDDTDTAEVSVNPVITSGNSDESFSQESSFSIDNNSKLSVTLRDGGVEDCHINHTEHLGNGATSSRIEKYCEITGLEDKAYKVVAFNIGQDGSGQNIGFIMTDGTVQYFPLADAIKNDDFSIKGTLAIDGNVVDVVYTSIHADNYNSGAELFILDNGTIIRFRESMF